MTTTAIRPSLPASVYAKLAALRRAVYLWLALGGAAQIVLLLTGMFVLSFSVDWVFRMDRVNRAIVLFLGVGALAIFLYRWLVIPLAGRLGDEALALRVEARNRSLGQSLISALQFAKMTQVDEEVVSTQLLQAAIDQGAQAAAAADFGRAIDERFRRRAGVMALGALICALLVSGSFLADSLWNNSYLLGTWFRRNILLDSEARWQARVELALLPVTDPNSRIAQGDNFEQQVAIVRGSPGRIYLQVQYGSFDAQGGFIADPESQFTEDLGRVGSEQRIYGGEIKNVARSFRLRANGAELPTSWRTVQAVERPRIESIQVVCRRPDYTQPDPKKRVEEFFLDAGNYETIRGSQITFNGVCSKPLTAKSQFTCNAKPVGKMELLPDEPGAAHRFRATLTADELVSGTYAFKVVDSDSLEPSTPTELKITVIADKLPEVRAGKSGIGSLITPRAIIPIACHAIDDYGVISLAVIYKIGKHAAATVEGDSASASGAPVWGEPRTLAIDPEAINRQHHNQLPGKDVNYVHELEAEPLKLEVGMQLTLKVEARDNCTVPPGPNSGASTDLGFAVVSDKELHEHLLEREKEQHLEFERIVRDQQALRIEVQGVLDDLKHLERDPQFQYNKAQDLDLLSSAERRQRLMGERCRTISSNVAQIFAETVNNDLEHNDPNGRHLQDKIIAPLGDLIRDWIPHTTEDIATAHLATIDDNLRRQAVEGVICKQIEILKMMDNIKEAFAKYEGLQQIINMLKDVLLQTEKTIKAIHEREKVIIGGTPDATTQP